MAQIIIPAQEAISVLRANMQPVAAIKSMDVTQRGPRLGIRLLPILPTMYIIIRFVKFEASIALFELDGMPASVNLNSILKLPQGITASGSRLSVNTDVLIRDMLKLRGLRLISVAWSDQAYHIATESSATR